ncbi:hypothetical protein SLG_23860 [Sphingobium sp. SYK-6]|nr:hypothetical protein SLG_23860 [Sphingobium sp. SYK-6]
MAANWQDRARGRARNMGKMAQAAKPLKQSGAGPNWRRDRPDDPERHRKRRQRLVRTLSARRLPVFRRPHCCYHAGEAQER